MSRSKGNYYYHCLISLAPHKIILFFGKIASFTSLFTQCLAINRATPPNWYLFSISNHTCTFRSSYRCITCNITATMVRHMRFRNIGIILNFHTVLIWFPWLRDETGKIQHILFLFCES